MSESLKRMYGHKLGVSDGEMGHVKDFYFDDHTWTIRYLVADTGEWLPGRLVLIPPHVLGIPVPTSGKVLPVNLTRGQIEASPSIATHKPVSRLYEEEYHRYYGWPFYWHGDGLWGTGGTPVLELPGPPVPLAVPEVSHLRSTQVVNGYLLRTGDEMLGYIRDFIADTRTWKLSGLVVRIGHRLSGRDVVVPVEHVTRICYEESTVYVDLTRQAIEQSPACDLVPA